MIGMPKREYIIQAVVPTLIVAIVAAIPSILVVMYMPQSYTRLVVSVLVGIVSVSLTSLFIGMTSAERNMILTKASTFINNIRKR